MVFVLRTKVVGEEGNFYGYGAGVRVRIPASLIFSGFLFATA